MTFIYLFCSQFLYNNNIITILFFSFLYCIMDPTNKNSRKRQLQGHIRNVKKELDKLNNIINLDKQLHQNTIKALNQCQIESSSGASSFVGSEKNAHKIQFMVQEREFIPDCITALDDSYESYENISLNQNTVTYNIPYQQSLHSTDIHTGMESNDTQTVDVTVKKVKNNRNLKKKDQSQISSNKGTTKLKNIKSEKKIFTKKKIVEVQNPKLARKIFSPSPKIFKQDKQKGQCSGKKIQMNTKNHSNKTISKVPQKIQNLTSASQSRGLAAKYHLNLTKQVNMKINNLNIKKTLCQKQSQYLSLALKITKQQIQSYLPHLKRFNQESYLRIFTLKSIIRFFSQFLQEIEFETQFEDLFLHTIESPYKLIKTIMKLPDILRSKNILSQQKCKLLKQQYEYLSQKWRRCSTSANRSDIFSKFMIKLNQYIKFLLENDIVHRTKRRNIFTAQMQQFYSDRSKKQKKTKNNSMIPHKDKKKQYDTQRKKQQTPVMLKRNNTTKILSPKIVKNKK